MFHTWKRGTILNLSPHFTSREFECPCGCIDQKISVQLIDDLEVVRAQLYNKPITVTAGFRCHSYQLDLGKRGYETAKGISQHELGNAADIKGSDMTALEAAVRRVFLAVGVAKSFIHVDLRDDKPRFWSYRSM